MAATAVATISILVEETVDRYKPERGAQQKDFEFGVVSIGPSRASRTTLLDGF